MDDNKRRDAMVRASRIEGKMKNELIDFLNEYSDAGAHALKLTLDFEELERLLVRLRVARTARESAQE